MLIFMFYKMILHFFFLFSCNMPFYFYLCTCTNDLLNRTNLNNLLK